MWYIPITHPSPHTIRTLSTGLNASPHTPLLWPRSVTPNTRSGSFHNLAVLSKLPVATSASLGDTATALISLSCPATAAVALRDITRALLYVLRCDAVLVEVVEVRFLLGREACCARCAAVPSRAGVMSHTLSILSAPAETRKRLVGRLPKATAVTAAMCPSAVARQPPCVMD